MTAGTFRTDGDVFSDQMVGQIHQLNRILSEDEPFCLASDTDVRSATAELFQRRVSQAPVIVEGRVVGVFTLRAVAKEVLGGGDAKVDVSALTAQDCMETWQFARVTDLFTDWLDQLERNGALLIGEPDRLQGIITIESLAQYLYRVGRPFLLLEDIERALRDIILRAARADQIAAQAKRSLAHKYEEKSLPDRLEVMEFSDYVSILTDRRHWDDCYRAYLSGDRLRAKTKLEVIRELRNKVFHFRDELTAEEHDHLVAVRDWIARRLAIADASPPREDGT